MKPHPKIRKTVKWGGAVVTVLLLVVWIGSGAANFDWHSADGRTVRLSGGTLLIDHYPWITFTEPGFTFFGPWRQQWRWQWQWQWLDWRPYLTAGGSSSWPLSMFVDKRMPNGWSLELPLWTFALPMLGITAAAWRLDVLARRREGKTLCPKCNYDRAGLIAGAVCPECGSSPKSA